MAGKAACAACGKEAGFFSSRRLADGSCICRECQKVIPAPFLDRQYPSAEDARVGAEYGRWVMAKLSPAFAATAQYGRMFLDERNGLFTLMKRMEDDCGKAVVILAGYTDEMRRLISSNPGFTSRFRDCIEFPDYTDQELCEIFQIMANGKGVCLSTGAMERFSMRIAAEKVLPYFGNARTVRKIVEEAMDLHALHLSNGTLPDSERFRLSPEDIPAEPDKGVFRDLGF